MRTSPIRELCLFFTPMLSNLGSAFIPRRLGRIRVTFPSSITIAWRRTVQNGDGAIAEVTRARNPATRRNGRPAEARLRRGGVGDVSHRGAVATCSKSPHEYHLSDGRTVQDVVQALSRLGFEAIHVEPDGAMGAVWAVPLNRS